jgi:hypothetical protein
MQKSVFVKFFYVAHPLQRSENPQHAETTHRSVAHKFNICFQAGNKLFEFH